MATSHNGDFPLGLVDQDNAAKAPEVDPRSLGIHSELPGQVHAIEEKKLPFG